LKFNIYFFVDSYYSNRTDACGVAWGDSLILTGGATKCKLKLGFDSCAMGKLRNYILMFRLVPKPI
jgi:hypothetical protein